MQNNELMDRLLGSSIEKGIAAQKQELQSTPTQKFTTTQPVKETNMVEIRIISARYKVYAVLILILMCIFGLNLIPKVQKSYTNQTKVYNEKQATLSEIESDIHSAELDENLLAEIMNNEANLINCLNKKENCSELPESWNQDLSVPLSYIQASSLHSIKMAVDEKKVLKNLDTYLIRKEIGATNSRVGDIKRIVIGDPKAVANTNEHFFEVPVSVTIEFENIGGLTGFLFNIEKQIIEESADRILYKVQSVSYDVIASNEPQIADISMIAYYYYDERFENIEQTTEIENIEIEDSIATNVDNDAESQNIKSDSKKSDGKLKNKVGSFIDGFFGK